MPKENVKSEEEAGTISNTGKDIKEGMDRYEAKMRKSAALGTEESAPPEGDSTRSEE
jgi:hypothetical protein